MPSLECAAVLPHLPGIRKAQHKVANLSSPEMSGTRLQYIALSCKGAALLTGGIK